MSRRGSESTTDRAEPSWAEAGPWDDWHNAEIYDGFVRGFPIYRELNRRLAIRAEIATARRVLDLASGTGATARACLRLLPADAELVGVDGSQAMTSVAAARTADPRAHFVVAPAAAVERAVRGPFDRALCSAALWQFPAPGRAIAAVGRLLEDGGLFVFNVPAHRLADHPSEVHPLQVALAGAVADRLSTRHRDRSTQADDPAHLLHTSDLHRWLCDAGFAPAEEVRHVVRSRQHELLELMRIPAMAWRMAPDLPETERDAVLDEAAARVDLGLEVDVPWVDFVARRAL